MKTVQERVAGFCRKCKNREFDPQRGIVCKLTQKKPDFEEECPQFLLDEVLVEQEKEQENLREFESKEVASLDEATWETLCSKQNLGFGIGGGILAAVVSALLWAAITVATNYQIGYMAILVGLIVGFAVRYFGIGFQAKFGIVGGALALLGCLLGNLFSQVGFYANELNMTYLDVLRRLNWDAIKFIYKESFSPMDILFYLIATYEGFRFSLNKVTHKLVQELTAPDEELPARYRFRFPVLVMGVITLLFLIYLIGKGYSGMETVYYEGTNVKMGEGYVKKGEPDGEWNYWDPNGVLSVTAHFKDGVLEGEWVSYEDGEINVKGQYINDLQYGSWISYYPGGVLKDSVFYQLGGRQGGYISRHENGSLHQEGAYLNNQPTGRWTTYYDNRQIASAGEMHEGIYAGDWTYYYENGRLRYEITYSATADTIYYRNMWKPDGEKIVDRGEGLFMDFDEEGRMISSITVRGGLLFGPAEYYDSHNRIRERGIYDVNLYRVIDSWTPDGKQTVRGGNGTYRTFYDDGVVSLEGELQDGWREGVWTSYYISGAKESEITYLKGKTNGEYLSYYETGKIKNKVQMVNGEPEGEAVWYYEDGTVETRQYYRDGQLDGMQFFYDESGNLDHKAIYRLGELVEEVWE